MFNLKELLEGKQSVALGGHVRPDGDCVGSTMGLYLYLKENFPQIETDLYLESVPEAYSMIRHPMKSKVSSLKGKSMIYSFVWTVGICSVLDFPRNYS